MENEVLQWMSAIGTLLSPLVVLWIGLGNRRRNVVQAMENHSAIRDVAEKVNIVEAKVEQVEGKVVDVGSQVTDVSDNVNGRFSQSQQTTDRVLDHILAIDPAKVAKAADDAAAKIVETADVVAERLARTPKK